MALDSPRLLAGLALVAFLLVVTGHAESEKDVMLTSFAFSGMLKGLKEGWSVCDVFGRPDDDLAKLSPEIVFITNRQSRVFESGRRVSEIAREFWFHADNVTLAELIEQGFNPRAPVSFVMHGFTSGYPLQAWISALVQAYTIDRELRKPESERECCSLKNNTEPVDHNLFIVNWNFGARGQDGMYPRAVSNIPVVATFVAQFINKRLLEEARVEPQRIQLIGHSLGGQLAGAVARNADKPLGRIYGLDPAGPCFGSGPVTAPSSPRLRPSDALEVIDIVTDKAQFGNHNPLGTYTVFVEGGENQPGCDPSTPFRRISQIVANSPACSHGRAPSLVTYRHDQSDSADSCQMMAYACKSWDDFKRGHCGVCAPSEQLTPGHNGGPLDPVECLRIGLDWQYPEMEPKAQTLAWKVPSWIPWFNRKSNASKTEPVSMFMRTGDTQPYCTFHYQIVLELNEPFPDEKPSMSLLLQDSRPTGGEMSSMSSSSLLSQSFGNKYNDKTYTELMVSHKKLRHIDHATLVFGSALKDGYRILKSLRVNYMSHMDSSVRRGFSSRLCPVETEANRPATGDEGHNRYFFECCDLVDQ